MIFTTEEKELIDSVFKTEDELYELTSQLADFEEELL